MRSLVWALIQLDWRPYTKGHFGHRDTHARREGHVMTKAEIGVMLLQAKEHQRLPDSHWKLGDRPGTDSPLEGTNSADTLILDI